MHRRWCLLRWVFLCLLVQGAGRYAWGGIVVVPEQQQAGLGLTKESLKVPGSSTPTVGDAERSAITFTTYDLDVHLSTESDGLAVVARVTIRNDGPSPLAQVPLQVSSFLHWDGASEIAKERTERLLVNQHQIQTDADRSGQANEALINLLSPLPPRGSADLTLLYSGKMNVAAVGGRAGTSSSEHAGMGPDVFSGDGNFLRGFGDLLWYPTASPQVFLGEGADLLHNSTEQMRRQATASVRMRVTVEYVGEAPTDVFFCGRHEALTPQRDDPDAPIASSSGTASAEFPKEALGFRTPALFVTGPPVLDAGGAIGVVSADPKLLERLSSAAAPALELVGEWMGKGRSRVLTVVDHPGAFFSDTGLLVGPMSSLEPAALTAALVPSLAHTRFRSAQHWLDAGVPQFMSLLWVERASGRAMVLKALQDESHGLALAESISGTSNGEQTALLAASDPVYFRTKSAAVLWMLRDIVGEDAMKQGMQRYVRDPQFDRNSTGFERLLEQLSGKDLRWFFDDWVYRDRGLPDLSIVSAVRRELPSKAANGTGWLVAVEVRNDGGAVADVPVVVRSGTLTASERLRIGAHSAASTRILFQGIPEEVQVNEGTVPEMGSSTHVRGVVAP